MRRKKFFGMRQETALWSKDGCQATFLCPDYYLVSSLRCCSLPFTVSDFNWPSSSTSTRSCPFSTILQHRRQTWAVGPVVSDGKSEGWIPFCGDFSAVDELGGSGHGSEVSHPPSSSSSSPVAAERWGWERGDSSSHVWKWRETCKKSNNQKETCAF